MKRSSTLQQHGGSKRARLARQPSCSDDSSQYLQPEQPCASLGAGDSPSASCSGAHGGPWARLELLPEELQSDGAPQQEQDAMLDSALTHTDAALNVTLRAMSLAAHMCAAGSSDAADRALSIAEQALAATVAQLAKAQALVVRKHTLQPAAWHGASAVDEELADTGISAFCCSSALV